MRYIKNDVQTPKHLVPIDKRRTPAFFLLAAGVIILIAGTTIFFASFFFREMITRRWGLPYRMAQTYSLVIGGVGIIIYIIAGLILKVPLRKTTYYKVSTIMENKPFDPPRKGDFSKALYARMRDLSDEWAYFTEIVPPDSDYKIPQVQVGPGGVFATCPMNEFPDKKSFKDTGPDLERASRKLGNAIGQQVTPILVFSTPKLVSIYKDKHDVKTRVMNIREISNYLEKRKNKLSAEMQIGVEEKIYTMIQGTQPGMEKNETNR